MKAPKPPAPPDPNVVAGAQTATNIGTAIANTAAGQVNQITPEGSLTYAQRGTHRYTDPNTGKIHVIPQYSARTKLSPQQQRIFDQTQGAELGMAQTANKQSRFLRDYLGEPAKFDTAAIEGRIDELGRSRLDPRFEQERAAMEQRLANQGIAPGSAAWNAEMRSHTQAKNDAYNQLHLQGRGQAFDEIAAMRNQPINEITALLSGSQVSMPNVQMAQPERAPTTDYAGIVSDNYRQRLNVWDRQSQNRQSMLGGLFGLGGNIASAAIPMMSDRRVKEDIKRVGTVKGNPVYEYRYKGRPEKQIGLMAQDVEKKKPEAVSILGGIKHVNYAKALGVE